MRNSKYSKIDNDFKENFGKSSRPSMSWFIKFFLRNTHLWNTHELVCSVSAKHHYLLQYRKSNKTCRRVLIKKLPTAFVDRRFSSPGCRFRFQLASAYLYGLYKLPQEDGEEVMWPFPLYCTTFVHGQRHYEFSSRYAQQTFWNDEVAFINKCIIFS